MMLNVCVFSCIAQTDTVFNQVDAKGQKQGYWKQMMTDKGNTYLYSVGTYKDNKRDGFFTYYYPDGKIYTESNYKNDTLNGVSKVYRNYGPIRYEESFKDGKSHGFKKYFNSDGILEEEQEYTEGIKTGVYRMYFKSGKVRIESYYINGVENGIRRVFADNDKKEIVREFDFKNGVRIAARSYKKGKLVKEEKFDYNQELRKDEELRTKNQTVDG